LNGRALIRIADIAQRLPENECELTVLYIQAPGLCDRYLASAWVMSGLDALCRPCQAMRGIEHSRQSAIALSSAD
jgi:hypothetical protein